MQVFTVASQKGGVGKTTVVLNLAYALAGRGWRTLIVDADPLGAIGLSLSKRMSQAAGLADVLAGRTALADGLVQTKLARLEILPVGRVPATDTMTFHAQVASGDALRRVVADAPFDAVLFDTPSGFVGATLGAMRASDYVLCPVQAEPVAARSMLRVFDVLGELRSEGSQVELLGFLLTMVQSRQATSASIVNDLTTKVPDDMILDVVVPRDPVFLEASGAGVPVGLLRRRPPAAALIFDQLAETVEQRSRLSATEGNDEPVALVD